MRTHLTSSRHSSLAVVLLVAALTLVVAHPARAQFSMAVDASGAFDNVSFVEGGETRGAGSLVVDAGHALLDDRVSLTYRFDAEAFSTAGDWLLLQQTAGATWRVTFGDQDAHRLHLGGLATLRHNGESWGAGGFWGASAFANVEMHPSATASIRTGLRMDRRAFDDLPEMDHTQYEAFGSGLINLPSRTTLIGEVSLGAKQYDGGGPAASAVRPGSVEAGSGRGAVNGQRAGVGASSAVNSTVGDAGAGHPTAYKLALFGRLAQSLAARTSLTVEASERRTTGDVPPAVVEMPPGFFDDGVYDDPYASDATTIRSAVKQVWASQTTLTGQVAWFDRRYRSRPAYDLSGAPLPDGSLRRDEVLQAGVTVRLPVATGRTGAWGVALLAAYDYTRHRSNDAAYHYTSHAIALGAALAY